MSTTTSRRTRTPEKSRPPAARGAEAPEAALLRSVDAIRRDLLALEAAAAAGFARIPEDRRASARNLVHYVGLRRHDVRALQEELAELGLSSLGRAESHVMATIDSVHHVLSRLTGAERKEAEVPVGYRDGRNLLERNTEALFGLARPGRRVRILVTMPTEAAGDYALVRDLIGHGMDAVRINCVHDGPEEWAGMIAGVRRAAREAGRACPVLMDLGGPKLRTGPLAAGPAVVSWRPQRDSFGRVLAPSRLWLTSAESPQPCPLPGCPAIPVPASWLASLGNGDRVRFTDTRGAARTLKVVGETGSGRWAESNRSAYVGDGTPLQNVRTGEEGRVVLAAGVESPIVLKPGDTLIVTRALTPGRPAQLDGAGRVVSPATVGCTLPDVFGAVRRGERVFFDDGRIGGIVKSAGAEEIHVAITQAREKGEKLRSDKGINLPDTNLVLAPLTPKDIEDLPFVAAHADLVGFSFVQTASDVGELARRLGELGAKDRGLVLKIETRRAFEALPELLLAALALPRAGVMIARGDLLVECGYERLAEIQEEILWLCEAAHLPVFWATQVLESLAQKGLPSRAEITDAAMGERAECVMLNKGPHIVEAVEALDNILRRMQAHQSKKTARLRRLHF